MTSKVIDDNEIYLGGTYYPLMRPVQSTLASIYPAKVVIGDTTRDSQLRSSVISWSDWRGGIGVDRMQGPADADRAWYSTCQLRYRHHLVLPALSTQTRAQLADSTAVTGAVTFIAELGTTLYVGFDNKPYYYSEGGETHGADHLTQVTSSGSAYAFPSTPTDAITIRMASTDYIVVAHTGGFSYFSSATTVTDATTDAKYLTFWDDRLWGIDSTGQLWYTLTIGGTPVNDARLVGPVQDNFVTDLFVGRDASGGQIIYAATKVGLYAHDAANSRWVETQFQLPFHNFNGVGSVRWRDSIYTPSGLGIYKYINGNNNAVITVMGPDRDDGLPAAQRGTIKKLTGTHTELLAAVDATTAPASQASTDWSYHVPVGQASRTCVIDASTGQSSILAWNDTGWETKWSAPTSAAGKPIEHLMVANAGKGDYRMWWGFNGKLYNQLVPFDVLNPAQLSTFEYDTSGVHETPWFDAQQTEVDKLALKLKVEVQDTSSNETVKVDYALNYSDTYETSLGTISSDGTTTYTFGSGVGVTFRSIRFKLTLARQSGSTAAIMKKSPDVVSITLEYRKKLEAKYGHTVEVSLNETYKGKDAKQLRAALISSIESNTLQEFTFRDDSGGTRNYYVDITSATGIEYTGYDERGTSRITLVEP